MENISAEKYMFIVNPNAGKQKIKKDWPKIRHLLSKADIAYDYIFTEYPGHAKAIAAESIQKSCRKFIIVGGDGTLHEVVNGIATQNLVPSPHITLGIIPVGTGNDWGRMYNIPNNYAKAVEIIKAGHTFLQDMGMVSCREEGMEKTRYFANMGGMGFDAFVAAKTNRMKAKGKTGAPAYLFNLLTGMFQYKPVEIKLIIDEEEKFSGKIYSMNAGICKYNGGGMMQLPHAIADDGLLAITLIRDIPKWKVLANIKNLYDGSFVKIPEAETFTGKTVCIESSDLCLVEADGESLGHAPLHFQIRPKGLKIIVPSE